MAENLGDADTSTMTEEEANELIYSAIIEIIRENLEEPVYEEPQEVVVHYGLMDEASNTYGITEEDGEKVGAILFSQDTE